MLKKSPRVYTMPPTKNGQHESIGLAKANSAEEKTKTPVKTPTTFCKNNTRPAKQTGVGVKEFLEETTPPSTTSSPSARTEGEEEEEEERKEKRKKKKNKTSVTHRAPDASRANYEFTPSTAEDHRVFDDEDKPATRGKFGRMMRIMKDMNVFIQDVMSDQAGDVAKLQRDVEEARSWATAARAASAKLKNDINHVGKGIQEVKEETKEVLEVHRDRIDGVEK